MSSQMKQVHFITENKRGTHMCQWQGNRLYLSRESAIHLGILSRSLSMKDS